MKPTWLELGTEIENKGQTPPWFKQVHGATALNLDGRTLQTPAPEADAGYTRDRAKTLYVFTADCLPVLLFGQTPDCPVAAIHAGWRGALAGVVDHTLREWGYARAKTRAWLGPSIGACCFEVKQDFIDAFEKAKRPIRPYLENRGGKTFCDLVRFVVKEELHGVESVDTQSHRCTVCSEPRLPSYRRNGKADPMIRSWIRKA